MRRAVQKVLRPHDTMEQMNVTVIGTGYVGLVTGCCLAASGENVTCVDNNLDKIAVLKRGKSPIYELGLEELLEDGQKTGRLHFTADLAEGVANADVIFLALPTPPQDDGSADLSAVLSVAGQLGPLLPDHYVVIINKSTVPVGTAEAVRDAISTSSEFDVVSNPEFLREGNAVKDFMQPDRVVIGADSDRALARMRKLYASFVDDERPFYATDPRTAELTKYAANSFLLTKISFMNEISQLAERMGADVDMIRLGMGADERIGPKFLYAGIGSGGSCFPKDTRALKHMAESHNYNFKVLDAAIEANEQQKHVMVEKVKKHFGDDLSGKTIALWGLAFKPGTDDIRESPPLTILDGLLASGARVAAYDPQAADNVRHRYGDIDNLVIVDDKYAVLDGADALIIATEWPEFIEADLERVKSTLRSSLIFDGRNIYALSDMRDAGFTYISIGRPEIR